MVGFGKLVLKGGKLIGVFHDEEGSDYYRGVRFQRVLDFMQRNPKGVQMYQRILWCCFDSPKARACNWLNGMKLPSGWPHR